MNIAGYDIKDEVVSEIGKFAILWNEFERQFTNYGKRGLELCAEQIICGNTTYSDFYERFRKYLLRQKEFSGKASTRHFVEYFLYTEHARRNPDPSSREEVQRQKKINYICDFIDASGSEKEKAVGCLYIIHRYRDNLMHGLKDLNGLNNQFFVIQEINLLLESLVNK